MRISDWSSDVCSSDLPPSRSFFRVGSSFKFDSLGPTSGLSPAMRALYGALASPVNRKVGIFHKIEKYRPASAKHGNTQLPIRNLSTACAHCRSSRMAHTTRDCPLRMLPQANRSEEH